MFCTSLVHDLSVYSYKNSIMIQQLVRNMSDDHTNYEMEHGSHSTKHMLLMMLCCMLPIIAIVVVSVIFPEVSYLNFLFVLICPLSMALMMLPTLLSKKKNTNESCH